MVQRDVGTNDLFPEVGRLILLTCHRRESWGEPFRAVCSAARQLANRGDCEIVFVMHPNPELIHVAHETDQASSRECSVPSTSNDAAPENQWPE